MRETGVAQRRAEHWQALAREGFLGNGIEWAHARRSGVALTLVDSEAAADRLADQRYENAREIRDVSLAWRLAGAYDDGSHHVVERLLNERADPKTRVGMFASLSMGYATLRDALAYDQCVSYLLACIVAFRIRERWDSERVWL